MNWRVEFKVFRDSRAARDDVFEGPATFAGQLPAERVIGISHALEKEHVVVVVWYWAQGSFWICPKCGESMEEQFDTCWRCTCPKPAVGSSASEDHDSASNQDEVVSSVAYRTDRGAWLEWDDFFGEIAKLASAIGPERVLSIAHAGTKDDALATVFYLRKKERHEQANEAKDVMPDDGLPPQGTPQRGVPYH